MRIAVVGTGYVGLVTGTCFAETGNTVTCVDIDPFLALRCMNRGEVPIYETGLEELFFFATKTRPLHFYVRFKEGIEGAKSLC